MSCRNNDIKELLPAYRENALDGRDRDRVKEHIASCGDCRSELGLLALLSAETVPDPGEAFWATMPSRVYKAVQDEKSKKKRSRLSRLADLLVLPRWAWAGAAIAAVLLVSWFVVSPVHRQGEETFGEEYEYSYGSVHDPVLTHPSMNMAELTSGQLETMDSWAGRELSAIADEAEPGLVNQPDSDPGEELADLDNHEIDRFSELLSEYEEEG